MTQVTVDRRVIWILSVALVLSLIGLAFVLGRASAPAPAAMSAAAAVQGPLSPPLGTPSHGPEAAPGADSSGPSGIPPLVEDPNPSMASLATPLPSGSERPAVQAYFAALDALQAQGLGSDPQGLAQEVAQGLGKGDPASLDRVLKETERLRHNVSQLQVPPPCATHHQACLAGLDDSLRLLRGLRGAGATADAAGLQQLLGSAQAMQARAQQLKQEDAALRARYGVR